MAITAAPYASFLLGLGKGVFNLAADPLRVCLVGSSYLPNMTTHANLSDVFDIVEEAEPMPITSVALTYSSTTFSVTATADDVVWPAATFSATYAVIYKDTSTAATSPLIGYINFGGDRDYDSEDFTLSFTEGFVQIPAV